MTVYYTFGGTATLGRADYTESGSGSVTFEPGVISTNVVVSVVNDAESREGGDRRSYHHV